MASIRQRGDKWQAQVRRKGVTPLVQSFMKYADAVKWARTIEATIDIGQEPPEASIMARTKFRQLLARYLAEVTPQKRSQRMETSRINRLLKHEMAEMALDKLTSGVFASFRDQRLKKVGPQTVRHDLNLLAHIIKTAMIDWDFPFKENPLDRLRKPAIPSGRIRRVSAEELILMRAGMERSESTYLMPMVDFAIETAMRRGEILGLLWKHIDLERGTAHLPMTKNGHSRTVPLSSKARAILSAQPRRRVRVFPVTETAVRLAWDRLMRRAKIKDLHFHDLRHEAISRLFEKGLSIPEVALISGHRDARMLFRYTHLTAEEVGKKLD